MTDALRIGGLLASSITIVYCDHTWIILIQGGGRTFGSAKGAAVITVSLHRVALEARGKVLGSPKMDVLSRSGIDAQHADSGRERQKRKSAG